MSVKVNSKKKLDQNMYNRMIIRQKQNQFQIDIQGEKYDTVPTDCVFSKNYKRANETIYINEVISYYLRYHDISKVADQTLPWREGPFLVASGEKNLLALQLNRVEFQNVISKIFLKYEYDRLQFLEKNRNIDHYYFDMDINCAYQKKKICSKDQEIIHVTLLKQDGKIVFEEKRFLEQFILDKIKSVGVIEPLDIQKKCRLQCYSKNCFFCDYVSKGFYIQTEQCIIEVDRPLFYVLNEIIQKHNQVQSKNKQFTLKF